MIDIFITVYVVLFPCSANQANRLQIIVLVCPTFKRCTHSRRKQGAQLNAFNLVLSHLNFCDHLFTMDNYMCWRFCCYAWLCRSNHFCRPPPLFCLTLHDVFVDTFCFCKDSIWIFFPTKPEVICFAYTLCLVLSFRTTAKTHSDNASSSIDIFAVFESFRFVLLFTKFVVFAICFCVFIQNQRFVRMTIQHVSIMSI